MTFKLPLWQLIPIYMQPKLTEELIETVSSGDQEALDNIVKRVEQTSNKKLCKRELKHTIERQFVGTQSLRELVQNSLDAYNGLEGKKAEIDVEYQKTSEPDGLYSFSLTDKAKGMTIDEIIRYLLVVGNSSKKGNADNMGEHGQGFFSLLRDSGRIRVDSKGWRTIISKDKEDDFYAEFDKIDSDGDGTCIMADEFHLGDTDFGSFFKYVAGYVDSEEAVIRLNHEQINSRDDFDFSIKETVSHDGKSYEVQVYMGPGIKAESDSRRQAHYTQRGLSIKDHSFNNSPEILADIPIGIKLTRGRNVVPESIEERIKKNIRKYRTRYVNYLISHLGDLTMDHVLWFDEVFGYNKVKSLTKAASRLGAAYVGIRSLNAILSYTTSSPTLSNLLNYAVLGFCGLSTLTLASFLGYTAYNSIRQIGKSYDYEKIPEQNKKEEGSLLKWIDRLSVLVFGFLPNYRFNSIPVVPAFIKEGGYVRKEKVSNNRIKKARRKGNLYFGEVGKEDGIYLDDSLVSRYSPTNRERRGFSVGLGRAWDKISSLHLPYYVVVPSTLTKVSSLAGIGTEKRALEEVSCYISGLVSEANNFQDVGVLTGYCNKRVGAFTIRIPGCAPAFVVLNENNGLIKALKKSIGTGFNSKQVNSLVNLVAHEYAHHVRKGFASDKHHEYWYWRANDIVKMNFYDLVSKRGIDITADVNNILQKYAARRTDASASSKAYQYTVDD